MVGIRTGVGVGTSCAKGVLARSNGEVVGRVTLPHDLSVPRPGWAEHDAETVWWADFMAICAALLRLADLVKARPSWKRACELEGLTEWAWRKRLTYSRLQD
mgnify:CR=1 FL=1